MSLFPVRCFTCGKVLKWEPYQTQLNKHVEPDKVLDSLGMRRLCCRRMYKSHVAQLESDLLQYEPLGRDPKVHLKEV